MRRFALTPLAWTPAPAPLWPGPFVFGPHGPALAAGARTVTFHLVGADGQPQAGRVVRAYVIGNHTAEATALVAMTDTAAVTDTGGNCSLSLLTASSFSSPAGTGTYRVEVEMWGSFDVRVPDGSGSVAFSSLVTP